MLYLTIRVHPANIARKSHRHQACNRKPLFLELFNNKLLINLSR